MNGLSGFSLPHRGHGVRVGAGERDEPQLPAARRPPFGNSEGITRRSGADFFRNPDSRSPAGVRGLPHRLGQGRRLVCLITWTPSKPRKVQRVVVVVVVVVLI